MGRAINMQKDIDDIKMELERLNNIIRGMASELSEVTEAVFDYEEDKTSMERAADAEKVVEEKKETEDVKEEADNQGDGKGDESDDSADRSADTKGK